ncbi:MAG: alpha-glucan family phosphorylase [Gammaproteobacteria bacterium]|nr:alpha-glucan family phosphorylase [Gammaproteobacteria bacterium]
MAEREVFLRFLQSRRVGYFSMEVALQQGMKTYSGGLGVLAGDTLRSAADLEIPMVGVTLVSRHGYFRQSIDANGRQVEQADPWEPRDWAAPLPAKISVQIEGRDVWVAAWLHVVTGLTGFEQPVILLDTDLPENGAEDRQITHFLYGGDASYRLKQEIVLGIGGVRMLDALGFPVHMYHLNEGHSALLTLELLRRHKMSERSVREGEPLYDVPEVRALCHFTTHTPVEAGTDRFRYELVDRVLGPIVDARVLRQVAGAADLNTTRLALNLSEFVNGVAKRHAETSQKMFPGFSVSAITNGIHPTTWASPPIARLFDRFLPGWQIEPELLMRADVALPDDEVWQCHAAARQTLIARVGADAGVALDPDKPILGYARRMTQYKRPDLLFTDFERLKTIAGRHPFQIVLAGKAHPRDEAGRRAIEMLHASAGALRGTIEIVFLPNYDIELAKVLIPGVDVWLNTPQPPMEASGTSGMKAALNAVPNLSVLDGWWAEGHIEGVTGWAIGNGEPADGDAASLYDKLEHVVLPLFERREAWLGVMKGAVSRNASLFHSHRMMRRYAAEAYLR